MKKPLFFLTLAVILLAGCKSEEDYSEFCDIAYSDVISTLVTGCASHWEEFLPGEAGLSAVYGYESPLLSFAQQDIDGDRVPELLIGDDFGEGDYQLYDIYTFNKETGDIVHLLCGGERNSFVVNGQGVIVETASNSAFETQTNFYVIENSALEQVESAEDDRLPLDFDRVLRYVAPSTYVAVKDGEILGRLLKTFDDCYLVEIQDSVRVAKQGVEIRLWSAYDALGVVYPAEPGTYTVYETRSTESYPLGTIVYEEGNLPPTFKCLGYSPGWLSVEFEESEAFVPEDLWSWDFVDRF